MKNTQIICDICLEDITHKKPTFKFSLNSITEYKLDKKIRKGDICNDCMRDFVKWVKAKKTDMRGEE